MIGKPNRIKTCREVTRMTEKKKKPKKKPKEEEW